MSAIYVRGHRKGTYRDILTFEYKSVNFHILLGKYNELRKLGNYTFILNLHNFMKQFIDLKFEI